MTYAGSRRARREALGVSGVQTVDSGSYVSIGALTLDPSREQPDRIQETREYRFEAVLEVVGVGVVAEIVLYRPADSTLLTSTLLNSNVLAEAAPTLYTSGAIPLTGGVNLSPGLATYEVYLRRSAGSPGGIVACKRAAVIYQGPVIFI